MTSCSLSDLVMLQMVGGLDRFTAAVMNAENAQQVIEQTRKKATVPHLFSEIVRKTIETQFSDPVTALRELGQNARDAYTLEQIPKKIEFTSKRVGNQLTLSCRDYGIGMQPTDVIKNLLIPYNSGKEFDFSKIGEHGTGWFSIMDISRKVEVRTRNGNGALTYAALVRENGEWMVSLDMQEELFTGTEVVLLLDSTKLDEAKILEGLQRHLGFAHPKEIDLTLNGVKVNTLASNYVLAGEALVENKELEGRLRLHMAKEKFGRNSDFPTVTQNGLYVKDLSNPFDQQSLHYDLFDKLRRYGVHFWLDLPANIGLTKGRNNIVAEDAPRIIEAMYPAFEQAVLDVIMEDEVLVQKLDHVIAEVVGEIFEKTYATTKVKVRDRLMERMRILKEQATTKITAPFIRGELPAHVDTNQPTTYRTKRKIAATDPKIIEGDYFLEVAPKKKTKEEQDAENKRKQYLAEVSGLSKDMITKRFIPSTLVDSQGVHRSEKISIEDMIVAYEIGALYDDVLFLDRRQGVYVDRSNAVVNKVYEILHRDEAEIRKMNASLKQQAKQLVARIEDNSTGRSTEVISISIPALSEDNPKYEFERTGPNTFRRIFQREGIGGEYLTFFSVMTYLDRQVSKPNKMPLNHLAIHHKRESCDIAHTNYEGISFNLNSSVIQKYLEAIRQGNVGPEILLSMLELVLHEKAHCQESYSSHLSHGNDFFVVRKKGLRDKTIANFQGNYIDPLAGVDEIVQRAPRVKTALYSGEQLGELVRRYKKQ